MCAASLWKVLGQAGFRPSIACCAVCARPMTGDDDLIGTVSFSPSEGGIACRSCARPADAVPVEADTLRWCEALIRARFDEVLALDVDVSTSFAVLSLAQLWVRTHLGRPLKSLDFLFTSGMF